MAAAPKKLGILTPESRELAIDRLILRRFNYQPEATIVATIGLLMFFPREVALKLLRMSGGGLPDAGVAVGLEGQRIAFGIGDGDLRHGGADVEGEMHGAALERRGDLSHSTAQVRARALEGSPEKLRPLHLRFVRLAPVPAFGAHVLIQAPVNVRADQSEVPGAPHDGRDAGPPAPLEREQVRPGQTRHRDEIARETRRRHKERPGETIGLVLQLGGAEFPAPMHHQVPVFVSDVHAPARSAADGRVQNDHNRLAPAAEGVDLLAADIHVQNGDPRPLDDATDLAQRSVNAETPVQPHGLRGARGRTRCVRQSTSTPRSLLSTPRPRRPRTRSLCRRQHLRREERRHRRQVLLPRVRGHTLRRGPDLIGAMRRAAT